MRPGPAGSSPEGSAGSSRGLQGFPGPWPRPGEWAASCLGDEIAYEVRQRHGRAMDLAVVVLQIAYAPGRDATIGLQRRQISGIERRRSARHHPQAAVQGYGNEIRNDD